MEFEGAIRALCVDAIDAGEMNMWVDPERRVDPLEKGMAAVRPGTGADARRVSKTMRTKER